MTVRECFPRLTSRWRRGQPMKLPFPAPNDRRLGETHPATVTRARTSLTCIGGDAPNSQDIVSNDGTALGNNAGADVGLDCRQHGERVSVTTLSEMMCICICGMVAQHAEETSREGSADRKWARRRPTAVEKVLWSWLFLRLPRCLNRRAKQITSERTTRTHKPHHQQLRCYQDVRLQRLGH